MDQKIICFGEMLWDVLPTGKLPGGAPMNVAIHLHHNGFEPLVISRIGQDDMGSELTAFVEAHNITTHYVQKDNSYRTGVVNANVSDRNEVTYEIVEPVAWDFIEYEKEAERTVSLSELFIYGSLAARSSISRNTLFRFLPLASRKVFDVNFRAPFYSPELIKILLRFADIVKMNHQELLEISNWLGMGGSMADQMEAIKDKFGMELVIVTRGENGAAALSNEGFFEHEGYKVEVEDTIGSGDAFLATYLTNYLRQKPTNLTLERACLIGAYVATQKGATPTYAPEKITSLSL
ncbi:carbohydrate kinase family protein [Rufibacter roseus]|uniref:Carbohydrate kinase n=1 Tax=Rufibacter roseus TaxID=1567108 RepID=A0ABW2DHS9_9BACT|nr:carbohydrate kinase [Rufibacter roseus]